MVVAMPFRLGFSAASCSSAACTRTKPSAMRHITSYSSGLPKRRIQSGRCRAIDNNDSIARRLATSPPQPAPEAVSYDYSVEHFIEAIEQYVRPDISLEGLEESSPAQ